MVRQSTTVTSSLQRRILRVLQARQLAASQLLGYVDAHPSEVRRAGRMLARLGFIADSGGRLVVTEAGEEALDSHYQKLQRAVLRESAVTTERAARRESAVTLERADECESTAAEERAGGLERAGRSERATMIESAVHGER